LVFHLLSSHLNLIIHSGSASPAQPSPPLLASSVAPQPHRSTPRGAVHPPRLPHNPVRRCRRPRGPGEGAAPAGLGGRRILFRRSRRRRRGRREERDSTVNTDVAEKGPDDEPQIRWNATTARRPVLIPAAERRGPHFGRGGIGRHCGGDGVRAVGEAGGIFAHEGVARPGGSVGGEVASPGEAWNMDSCTLVLGAAREAGKARNALQNVRQLGARAKWRSLWR
jgi:hypothetical protein